MYSRERIYNREACYGCDPTEDRHKAIYGRLLPVLPSGEKRAGAARARLRGRRRRRGHARGGHPALGTAGDPDPHYRQGGPRRLLAHNPRAPQPLRLSVTGELIPVPLFEYVLSVESQGLLSPVFEESPGFTQGVEDEVSDLDNGTFSPLRGLAPHTGWTDVTADDLAQKTSKAGHEPAGERRADVGFVAFEGGHE